MAASTVTLETLDKELKTIRKELRKIKAFIEDPTGEKAAARSQNNGFKKPLQVSPELRAFLSLGPEDRISRADVTKKVNVYLEAHNLKNGQNITMDETLKKLLNPPADTQITFLNIQKYINPHFVKEPKEPKTTKRKESEPALTTSDVKVERPKVAKKLKAAATA
jgi:upstream activation factor subunit UAF30